MCNLLGWKDILLYILKINLLIFELLNINSITVMVTVFLYLSDNHEIALAALLVHGFEI